MAMKTAWPARQDEQKAFECDVLVKSWRLLRSVIAWARISLKSNQDSFQSFQGAWLAAKRAWQ